jgi:hypothetical protein
LAAYFLALLLIYGEPLAWSGDTKAVLLWSAVAFGASFVVLYIPALHAVRRVLGGVSPRWPFPVLAGALGVVPTATIAYFNGGNLRSLLSQEAFLFYIMFAAVGLVVGVGFAVVHRNALAPLTLRSSGPAGSPLLLPYLAAQPRAQPDPPARGFLLGHIGGGGPVSLAVRAQWP